MPEVQTQKHVHLTLKRLTTHGQSVFGILTDNIGGTYFTLERKSKLIPEGTYFVEVCMSPAFGKLLPLVYSSEVSPARGIRIHGGNTVDHTQGCILIGNTMNLLENRIGLSESAIKQLNKAIGHKGTLTIGKYL